MQTPETEMLDALSHRVIKIAAEQVELPPDQITLDANFISDLGFDSLDVVEFTMRLEEEFDLTISDDMVDQIATVRQAVNEVRRLGES